MINVMKNTKYTTIHALSERLVKAQKPIRILDAIKWSDKIKHDFFKNNAQKLPAVSLDYYQSRPLKFNPDEKINEFYDIIRESRKRLGQFSTINILIEQRANDYIDAIRMLNARGTPLFSKISKRLYGGPKDVFYLNGPKLCELGGMLGELLKDLVGDLSTEADVKKYSAKNALAILQSSLNDYFINDSTVTVKLNDSIIADAAAGSDYIKLNKRSYFSDRELKYLEVHEGWVHVGTTLNGRAQPYCTFLSKGPPCSTVTQEGLAVIMELFTFNSSPKRLLKLANRVKAIDMADGGADFLEVYHFLLEQFGDANESYNMCVRIFRGSTGVMGPFTKDLSYIRGFLLIYNYLRLATKRGMLQNAQLLFCGKVTINDLEHLSQLTEQGIIIPPKYLPPQFSDMASLSSWMCLSLFLNKFKLDELEKYYSLF
jgi:uncharacterized protein (TIGR02421 family)